MARGKKCPQCHDHMYAVSENYQPAGTLVVYECRNNTCRFREKVFEDKRR